MKHTKNIILFSLLILLSGCLSTKQMREMESENSGFVYGKIDFSNGKERLIVVNAVEYPNGSLLKKQNFKTLFNGVFYLENIPPGEYYINKIQGYNRSETHYFPSDNSLYFKVLPGEIVDLGVIEIETAKGKGLFANDTFSVKHTSNDAPEKTLEEILEFAEGTAWEDMILKEIESNR